MGAPYGTDSRRSPRVGLLTLEALGLLSSLGYLAVVDPHDPAAHMPHCPIKSASGWDCPSCGGLRMVHHLLHGELRRAVADNLYLAVVSPVLLHLLCRRVRSLRAGERYEVPRRLAFGLLISAFAWGIVRNLAAWPWKPTRVEPGARPGFSQLEAAAAAIITRIPAATPR